MLFQGSTCPSQPTRFRARGVYYYPVRSRTVTSTEVRDSCFSAAHTFGPMGNSLGPAWFAQAATTMHGTNHRHLFSHSLGGWKSEIKVPAGLGSGDSSPPGSQMAASLRVSSAGGEGERATSLMSLLKGHSSYQSRAHPYGLWNLNHSHKGHISR